MRIIIKKRVCKLKKQLKRDNKNFSVNLNKRILLFASVFLTILLAASWIASADYTPSLFAGEKYTGIDQSHHNPLYTERIIAIGDGLENAASDNIIIDAASVGILALPGVGLNGGTTGLGGNTLHLKSASSGNIVVEGSDRGQILLSDLGASADNKMFALKSESGEAVLYSLNDDLTTKNNIMKWDLGTNNVFIKGQICNFAGTDCADAPGGQWKVITGGIDYSKGEVYIGKDIFTQVGSAANNHAGTQCAVCDADIYAWDCPASGTAAQIYTGAEDVCYDYGPDGADADSTNERKAYYRGRQLMLPGPAAKVGIGTASPRERLDIAVSTGEANIIGIDKLIGLNDLRFYTDNSGTTVRMSIDGSGNMVVTGSVEAAQFYYPSDLSLKENIKPISNALEKIGQLNGVEFTWKNGGGKSIGLIAQDAEKVFPELVSTGSDGLKTISYGSLVAPLIEAVKEQQTQIEGQQRQIDELKKEINNLKEDK